MKNLQRNDFTTIFFFQAQKSIPFFSFDKSFLLETIYHHDKNYCYHHMKKRITQAPVIDKNYLNELYQSIHDKIQLLDKLNENFKVKQEEHFIRSFMNVVEKMGNDLILAQQAYRNIDIEVKRDQYCMELATELQFFRSSCFQLKTALEKSEKALTALKIEKENTENELSSLHLNLEKKIKENMHLKAINKDLMKKLKQLANGKSSKNIRLSYSVDGRLHDKETSEANQEEVVTQRMLATQGGRRRDYSNHSQKVIEEDGRITAVQTPNTDLFSRFDTGKSASPATFRRRPLQKALNNVTSDLFK